MRACRTLLRSAVPRPARTRLSHLPVVRYSTSDSVEKDAELRQMFDSAEFWRDFSAPKSGTKSTGLFDNPLLDSPSGFTRFAEITWGKAKKLESEISNATSIEQKRMAIINLDRLSDVLCKVIDMVAFVRMAHPDPRIVDAAEESHQGMFEFMNHLNTSVDLYETLRDVLKDPAFADSFSEEERSVGNILLQDFIRSGVTLDPESREKFVDLSTSIAIKAQRFQLSSSPVKDTIAFSSSQVYGFDPQLAYRHTSSLGRVKIPTSGPVSAMALRTIVDEDVRKELWMAQRTASHEQEAYLTGFLRDRARLAGMMGSPSYADYELQDKMARNPANVMKFLENAYQTTYPQAKKELQLLVDLKSKDQKAKTSEFQAWDREYYSSKVLQARRAKGIYSSDTLSSYFSLGSVMQGLSRLFGRIYGIRFVPAETKSGEVWHEDVRRLNVISEKDGLIGVMYCDLFERQGKMPNPAHYTVQCSMEVLPDDPAYNDEDQKLLHIRGRRFQPPIIVLMCDFNQSPDGNCLLSFAEVETLFHEMGHAMHSMVGRTSLHNVSGTRCATDFVELPSSLMEHFASAPSVLSLYARHYKTGEPLPYPLLKAHLDNHATFKNFETYTQVKLSLLDQVYHSEVANDADFEPFLLYHTLERERGVFPSHEKSQWHTQFGHLAGYGATYYCYLLDRVIADFVWKKLFEADPLSRDGGEKFRDEVLKWGGSRDAWKCVAGVLDQPELAKGGETAMAALGNW